MSVPRSLARPPGSYPVTVPTRRGPLAAIRVDPPTGPSGPSDVLLVPGFTGSKEDFLPVLAPIAAAGHRVTAIDLRGQLDSAALSAASDVNDRDGEAAYGVCALAEDLLDVIADLEAPVHLLGHSFGGLVARAAALTSPGAVRSLTLLGSGPAAIPSPPADRLRALRPVLDAGGVAAVWSAAQALEAAEPGYVPPPPPVAAFLHRRYLAMPAACLGGMAAGLLTEADRVEELAATGLPVLVAHGEGDDAWPPAVQREMARRLGARYAEIPDSVHSPVAENPTRTVAILLDFWRSAEAVSG
jgi:pimeloyl-ACP methyl ester carboxylesterase